LNKKYKITNDYIEIFCIPQIVVNSGSQVNIIPKETWIKTGRPYLVGSRKIFKLENQRFIESIGLLKGEEINIMGLTSLVEFRVINLVEGTTTYVGLSEIPWGRKIKVTISIEKYRIELKGNSRRIIVTSLFYPQLNDVYILSKTCDHGPSNVYVNLVNNYKQR
jgi:hypothetical protein